MATASSPDEGDRERASSDRCSRDTEPSTCRTGRALEWQPTIAALAAGVMTVLAAWITTLGGEAATPAAGPPPATVTSVAQMGLEVPVETEDFTFQKLSERTTYTVTGRLADRPANSRVRIALSRGGSTVLLPAAQIAEDGSWRAVGSFSGAPPVDGRWKAVLLPAVLDDTISSDF